MRRKYIPFIATVIAFILTLAGCSCTGTSTLVFNDNFVGEGAETYPYSETLTYDVKYIESYNTAFYKSEEITDDVLDIDMTGEYTVTLNAVSLQETEALKDIESDLLSDDMEVGSFIYHLHTELNLKTNYSSKNDIYQKDKNSDPVKEIKNNEEYIETDAYFLTSGYSFNPIYSKTKASTSYVMIGASSNLYIHFSEYTSETKYNKNNYSMTTKYDSGTPIKNEQDYTFRTAIDNNMLLFALRNINIEVDENYILDVISPTYETPQSIKVVNNEENETNFTINENTEAIKYKKYSFVRNVASATGFPQYAFIQNSKTSKLENKSLLLEYVSTLNPQNSYLCLGGMQYKLKSVE